MLTKAEGMITIIQRLRDGLALVVLVTLLCLTTSAQDNTLPEYGDISELKDSSKVYVTSDIADARSRIIKELKKYAGLVVVNSPDGADFMLTYKVISQNDYSITSQMSASTKKAGGRTRILWEESESAGIQHIGKPNSVNLTRHFLKDIKKSRGEK